jgi:hypothetical protein
MNKARQIYYNAVFGAIGGLLAWQLVGLFATGGWPLTAANALIGAGVGLCIGFATGAVDGIVNKLALRPALIGGAKGAVIGLFSGAAGMVLGGLLFVFSGGGFQGRLLGWVLLGLLLGLGEGLVSRSLLRTSYGAIGGTVAGAIGGLLYELMTQVFVRQNTADAAAMDSVQMIMSAVGLILIGACLGALIPMTISLLAQGRLRVLSGPRAGLEVDVLDAVTLGSYDGCALYLPGDKSIARKHARVHRQERRFFVTDLDSQSGTRVDGKSVAAGAAVPIEKGAKIQMGQVVVELL